MLPINCVVIKKIPMTINIYDTGWDEITEVENEFRSAHGQKWNKNHCKCIAEMPQLRWMTPHRWCCTWNGRVIGISCCGFWIDSSSREWRRSWWFDRQGVRIVGTITWKQNISVLCNYKISVEDGVSTLEVNCHNWCTHILMPSNPTHCSLDWRLYDNRS